MSRPKKTLADYVVIAFNPALIMAMVGSLVFFLLTLFYRGQYVGRLYWVLGLFVFAAVLIGRISIELGAERAALYAMPLAVATMLAINKFVIAEGGTLGTAGLAVHLALMALVWWAAHKLVWDCTLIDDSQDSSGQGLLQAAGLEATDAPPEPEPQPDRPRTWRERFLEPRKKHAPGVWIVYFALAALPIFGFGHKLLADPGQRRTAFFHFMVYAASALGLLLNTAFLGLRRYLRQRTLPMPATMAGTWLALGLTMIVAILLLAALLPRPSPEVPPSEILARVTGRDPAASRRAVGGEGAQGQSQASAPAPEKTTEEATGGGEAKTGADEKAPAAKTGTSEQKAEGEGDKTGAKSGEPGREQDKGAKTAAEPEPNKTQDTKTGADQAPEKPQSQPPNPQQAVRTAMDWLGTLVKWLFYGALGLVVVVWAARNWRQIAEEIRRLLAELRDFGRRLFRGSVRPTVEEPPAAGRRRPTWADYPDPFATGEASRLSPDDLVRYTFEALEAWGSDRGRPRRPDETPYEYAQALAELAPAIAAELRVLAALYNRAAYAPGTLTPAEAFPLGRLWAQWQTVASA